MTKREKIKIARWKGRIQNQLDNLPWKPIENEWDMCYEEGAKDAFKFALKWFEEEINE